jgi:16S rRNA (guanine1207-N2)-methyltransferase
VCELDGTQRAAQAVVRISRGQTATAADLAAACRALTLPGLLAVVGANTLGIGSWVKRLQQCFGAPLRVQARAKSRLAVFRISEPERWPVPEPSREPWAVVPGTTLVAAPGVYNGGRLDAGTALLLEHLRQECDEEAQLAVLAGEEPAQRQPHAIADLGCGAGHLGLAALHLYPRARASFYDADWQAVASAQGNCRTLGLAERSDCHWWDAHEALPAQAYDLILANPPAHAGAQVDLGPATALVQAALPALRPGGRLLVVANQRLPYERDWARLASWRLAQQRDGYKILESPAGG